MAIRIRISFVFALAYVLALAPLLTFLVYYLPFSPVPCEQAGDCIPAWADRNCGFLQLLAVALLVGTTSIELWRARLSARLLAFLALGGFVVAHSMTLVQVLPGTPWSCAGSLPPGTLGLLSSDCLGPGVLYVRKTLYILSVAGTGLAVARGLSARITTYRCHNHKLFRQ